MKLSYQRFHILDPDTGDIIGNKRRNDVHRDGDWHRATNAFIFRKTKNSKLEVLLQERSEFVDIAQNRFDQSLATQAIVQDNNSPKKAILRGLKEELGIKENDIIAIEQLNLLNNWRIIKKYHYNEDLYNREIINNFGIVLKDKKISPKSIKVKKVHWIKWEQFCELVQIRPRKFTKTSRMFCINEYLVTRLNSIFYTLLSKRPINKIKERYFYLSYYNYDIMILENNKATFDIEIFDTKNSMKLIERYSNIEHIPPSIFKETDFINQFKFNKPIYLDK